MSEIDVEALRESAAIYDKFGRHHQNAWEDYVSPSDVTAMLDEIEALRARVSTAERGETFVKPLVDLGLDWQIHFENDHGLHISGYSLFVDGSKASEFEPTLADAIRNGLESVDEWQEED